MTDVEDRLRTGLVELADALLDDRPVATDHVGAIEQVVLEADRVDGRGSASRLGLAAACVLLVAAVGGLVVWRDAGDEPTTSSDGTISEEAEAETGPRAFGAWEPIADAPMEARSFPVAGWIDGEVVVWAGSSPNRGFAHTDGAAYDPAADVWRVLDVPGWGHPGLTATVVADRLIALAKGALTVVDPSGADWAEVSAPEGLLLVRVVDVDGELYGLGAIERPEAAEAVGVARYDAAADEWIRGSDVALPDGTDVWEELFSVDVVWGDGRLVVWDDAGAPAYDPVSGDWDALPALTHPDGVVETSKLAASDAGLVAVAAVVEPSGRTSYRTATLSGGAWSWQRPLLPTVDLEEVTVAVAGEWLVMFEPGLPPVTLHVPSGDWDVHLDGPLGGLAGAATVWTGSELIVWGGAASPTATVVAPVTGAKWTPPVAPG